MTILEKLMMLDDEVQKAEWDLENKRAARLSLEVKLREKVEPLLEQYNDGLLSMMEFCEKVILVSRSQE